MHKKGVGNNSKTGYMGNFARFQFIIGAVLPPYNVSGSML